MSFWDTATTAQRLEQIDGGIECGMNAAQIAMNCGCVHNNNNKGYLIRMFATEHGRRFTACAPSNTYALSLGRHTFVKRRIARTHSIPDEAFSIFGDAS